MGMRSGFLLLSLGVIGCGQAVTAHPVEGRSGAYEIECVNAAKCVAKAREVCGARFDVVSEWEHPLILPDAHPGSHGEPLLIPQQMFAWNGSSSNTGPSDAASAAPLHRLDVVCAN
jgi:hypothetical protein